MSDAYTPKSMEAGRAEASDGLADGDLALPDEPPLDVVDLAAAFPGTRYLVLTDAQSAHWPADLESGVAGSECFRPIELPPPADTGPDLLADTTVYEIACP